MARKRHSRRMHTEDARFLRELVVCLLDRINEIEAQVGHLQRQFQNEPQMTYTEEPSTEILAGE